MPRTRGTGYPIETIDRARALALADQTPTQIQRALKDQLRTSTDTVPAISTIKLWIKGITPASDKPWDPLSVSPDECRQLGPSLLHGARSWGDATRRSDVPWPTQSEAEWMVRVRAWFPDFEDATVWDTGRYLAASESADQRRIVAGLLESVAMVRERRN